ncbi:unnamed protein product [Miscanthus lutarioriparius]|uniref:Uncharacterized protein n=1 Tax=Miscanthus lutarioriparius TaxID=422564 RepID=A0A811QR35_9POAL|nr:unnamed protein product [Miscanthus lutarioriparius]
MRTGRLWGQQQEVQYLEMAGRSCGGRRAAAASKWAGEGRQRLMLTSHRRSPLSSSVIPRPQDWERKSREARSRGGGGTDGVNDGEGNRLLLDRSPPGGPPAVFTRPDRAAAISPAFRVAADADAVSWSSSLPRDLTPPADGELPDDPQSKKALFSPRFARVCRRKDECHDSMREPRMPGGTVGVNRTGRGKTDFLPLLPW